MVHQNKILQHKQLGLYLKKLRTANGMRQVDMAAALKQPQSFISKIESGERLLTVFEVERIVNQLGLDLVEFSKQYQKYRDEIK